MSKKYLQIQIPTPCSEDFSKMTPKEKGHFCNNCEKVVIDFSKMSDREIANFYKNNNGKLCGRFHASQLNRDIRLTEPKVNSFFGKAAGLLLSGILSAGATNMAAQQIENIPPISVVDVESENGKEGEEKTESLKERVIKIKVVNFRNHEEKEYPIEGATVTHSDSLTTSISNAKGIAELRIPESCFNEEVLSFSINHLSYSTKVIEIDAETATNCSMSVVEMEISFENMFYGYVVATIHQDPNSFENYGEVRDFDFEKEESELENQSKSLDKENSDFSKKDEDLSIYPPLGVAIKKIYPNPFIDRINIEISTEKAGDIQINLIDISGQIVFQKKEYAQAGTQQFQIEVGNLSLSGNMYILQVQDESGNIQSQQIMRFTNHGFTMR